MNGPYKMNVLLIPAFILMPSPAHAAQVHKQHIPSIRRNRTNTGRHPAHAATRYRQARLLPSPPTAPPPSSMAPPPRRNPPHQNPTRRKGEEPWLAASLRPANFLPGLAIGFLLGLLLDLSSSWRPKSSPAPAPAAAPARASSSKRASGTSFASGGEELKMVLAGSKTVLAIGPGRKADIDSVTGKLRLL
ncbi:hypothetical protein Zm00014a_027945 [Zea mays]|uniref:peptidyl-tRNA hydrolase n=1 Tax=Zea mays TaxID=4577 RepID=A0A3L6DLN4_MAIZE|nr:hypothetical protein Zm00014a_027945 [Zea mays]